jgi:signal transduction histidine kinase
MQRPACWCNTSAGNSSYTSFQSRSRIFLISDFCAGGELFNALRKQGLLLEDAARTYLAELVLARVDVGLVCREVAALAQPLAARNGNQLEVELPASSVELEVDGTRLRQILLNLLGNAAKFTREGRIRLTLERVDSGGGARLEFRVEDTGIGLTPEQLGRLFQPFVQATAGTSLEYGGSGLGLAISRRYAQMMGGDIEVRSEVGRGAVFTLWLRL